MMENMNAIRIRANSLLAIQNESNLYKSKFELKMEFSNDANEQLKEHLIK